MKKMFNKIVAAMISAIIALTFVGCTTGAESATDTAYLAAITATANDTEPVDNGIANDLEIENPATDTSAKVITLATATTTKQLTYTEKLVTAYQEGKWDGKFVSDGKNCYSLDERGCLYVNCEQEWNIYPDLPEGTRIMYSEIIARNSDGTWVYAGTVSENDFHFELWLRGDLVAQSEIVECGTYYDFVSSENGIHCMDWDGNEYTLEVVRDNLIVTRECSISNNPATYIDEEIQSLLEKLQKRFWAGEWNGEYQVIDGHHHVKIAEYRYDKSVWIIDNISYEVNIDVPLDGKWSNSHNWAIFEDGFAIKYHRGEVENALLVPERTTTIINDCGTGINCVDENGTLWHVDKNENVKIAENVVDVRGLYDSMFYLCQDGTAYTYTCQDGTSKVFAKNATEIGFYGDYGWGAVVPEAEANLNYHGKHLWVVNNFLD